MQGRRRGIAPFQEVLKPSVPRLRSAHSFAIRFLPIWIILFGASWGVSYGWMKYMKGCCSDTIDKQSFTYLEWIMSSVIFLWTILALAAKLYRMRLLVQIINSFMRLADSLFLSSSDAVVAANSGLVFDTIITTAEGPRKVTYNLDYHDALSETMLALICSVILLIYELMFSYQLESFVTDLVDDVMVKQANVKTSVMHQLFLNEKKEQYRSAGERSYSTIMLHVINERVLSMGTRCTLSLAPSSQSSSQVQVHIPQMFLTVQSVLTDIANLIELINNFKDLPIMMSEEWWISWPIMFIGIVFPFLIPPVFFSTMGSNILYIGPVIFFFIGSPVLVNIVLGDPIKRPSDLHMQKVYDQLFLLGDKIQYQFRSKFQSYVYFKEQLLQSSLNPPPQAPNPAPQQTPQQQQQQQLQLTYANAEYSKKLSSQITKTKYYVEKPIFEKAIHQWFQQPYSDFSSSNHTL